MSSLETAIIEKAINNGNALHSKVKMIQFGKYGVIGSKGNLYTVEFYRKADEKIVGCNCATRGHRLQTRRLSNLAWHRNGCAATGVDH